MSRGIERLFKLPPVSERVKGQSVFSRLTAVSHLPPEDIQAPDFYIIYKAGVWCNALALTLGPAAFFLANWNASSAFPILNDLAQHPEMLGVFGYLASVAGAIILLSLIYFFILVAVNVDFREWNLYRRHRSGKTVHELTGKERVYVFLGPIIGLTCLVGLEGWTSLFYNYAETFEGSYDNPIFVLVHAVFLTGVLSIAGQFFFFTYLAFSYMVHEHFYNVSGGGKR